MLISCCAIDLVRTIARSERNILNKQMALRTYEQRCDSLLRGRTQTDPTHRLCKLWNWNFGTFWRRFLLIFSIFKNIRESSPAAATVRLKNGNFCFFPKNSRPRQDGGRFWNFNEGIFGVSFIDIMWEFSKKYPKKFLELFLSALVRFSLDFSALFRL